MQALRTTNRAAVRRRLSPLVRAAVLLVALGAAILLALPAPPAVANDTSVGGVGGLVYPLESTDIRMRAETVQAVCYRSFAEYRVDFKFVNDGETQTVKLGFPFEVTALDEMGSPPVAFRAWQDGKPLKVTLGRSVSWEQLPSDYLGYYLHEATFPRGETTITVSYLAVPTISAGGRSDAPFTIAGERVNGWAARYDYWVHTGAGWKGTIEKTVVRFTLADDFGGWGVEDQLGDWETTKPGSYVKVGERAYQWVYANYEPSENDDIRLNYTRLNLGHAWVRAIEGIPASFGPMPMKGGTLTHWEEEGSEYPAGWGAVDADIETFWEIPSGGKDNAFKVGIAVNHNVRELRILPGRHDTLTSFGEYGRPKSMRVTLSDGTSKVLKLKDEASLQRFAISGKAEWVKFEVLDSYPGTKSGKTYISEIDFGAALAPEFKPFDDLMAAKAPPTTATTAPPATTSTSPVVDSTTATVTPSTSAAVSTTSSVTSLAGATSVPSTGSLTTVSPTTIAVSADEADSGRLLWPAWLGLAVAVLGLGALVYLVARLRRRGRVV
jgi:hypothetical protein